MTTAPRADLPDTAPHVLVVDDDRRLRELLARYLTDQGFRVTVAASAAEARARAQSVVFDAMVLDVMMPGENGFDYARSVRETSRVPILMLTARSNTNDRVMGLEIGADDYLPKPFAFQELLLRIRAISKRHELRYTTELRLADLTLNLTTKVVTRAQKRIELTSKEFALLEYMLLHKGKIISRAELAERVWETDFDSNTNVIDVYINYLRKKIDKDFSPKLVHTVIGMGYSLHES